MVETIKHVLGVCGEGHPNLFYLLGLTPLLVLVRTHIYRWFTICRLVVKNYLRLPNK